MQMTFQRAATEVSRLFQQATEAERAREKARDQGRAEMAEKLAALLLQQRDAADSEHISIERLVVFLHAEASALRSEDQIDTSSYSSHSSVFPSSDFSLEPLKSEQSQQPQQQHSSHPAQEHTSHDPC